MAAKTVKTNKVDIKNKKSVSGLKTKPEAKSVNRSAAVKNKPILRGQSAQSAVKRKSASPKKGAAPVKNPVEKKSGNVVKQSSKTPQKTNVPPQKNSVNVGKIPIRPAQTQKQKAETSKNNSLSSLNIFVKKSDKDLSKPAAKKSSAAKKTQEKSAVKKITSVSLSASKKDASAETPRVDGTVKLSSQRKKKTPEEISELAQKVRAAIMTKVRKPADFQPAKPRKGQHIRPSESIAFTLEDLDSYLERREHGNPISITKEIAISKKKATDAAKIAAPVPAPKPVPPANRKPLAPASIFDILGFNPVEAPSREVMEEKDVPQKWKKYYNLLIDLRRHHSAGVEKRSEEVMKRSVKDDSGDLSSYGQHLADAGSESFERDMTYNLLSNEKEILAEIDEAIKRIKNGTYGICEVTGMPIPESRLEAIPFTRYSKEGQERKELADKRMKASQRNVYDIPEGGASGSGEEDPSA